MDIAEIQDELLRLEYPNLLPDHDPDIERYYYLRSIGQARDAMAIYQNRLRVRYPEEQFRTWLLRAYRSHDPSFRGLLARGYRMLGARSLERVKGTLETIARLAESFNEKDVYSTIKTVESILQFLPRERYEAISGMDRYSRYANVLNLRLKSILKATELVRAYLTDSLLVVEEERRRRADALKRMENDERARLVKADWDSYYYQKKFGIRPGSMDLSAVVFSPEDLNRIEIPYYSRVEDQILAYCIKYWNFVDDPAFERILFLYSRKYGKKNYEVYTAIRRGRHSKLRDDEILASIMSVLVTGYYYSIQGDIYLQRNWNSVKSALSAQKAGKLALPAPKTSAKTDIKRIEAPAKQAERQKPGIFARAKAKSSLKIAPKPAQPARPATVAVARQASEPPQTKAVTLTPAKPVRVPLKLKPATQTKTTILPMSKRVEPPPKPTVVKPVEPPKPAAKPAVARKPFFAPKPVAKPAVQPKPIVPPKPVAKKPPVKQQKPVKQPKPVAAKPAKPAVKPKLPPKPAAKPIVARKPFFAPKPAAKPVPAQPKLPAKPVVPQKARKPLLKRPPEKRSADKPGQLLLIKAPIQQLPKIVSKPTPIIQKPAKVKSPVKKPQAVKAPGSVKPAKPKKSKPYRPGLFGASVPRAPKSKEYSSNRTLGKAKGSVSDRLKQLSGRSYDVYEDRFLSKARTSIRKVLGSGKGLFFSLPEEAEDLVYNFLRDHYSDPYMDWETSSDRKNLSTMGFELPSIHPVIDECFRAL
jgi:hypothetical protein